MPLDHYVSQVHLKNFYSPVLQDLMYAIRKSDLATFQCNSKSVCRIEDGSTNAYLRGDREVENFLKLVEPNYNKSLDKLRCDAIDQGAIFAIAGFVAYVISCSPAAMRIFSDPLRASVAATAAILERSGELPPSPPALGGKTLTELLSDGMVQLNIDPKFPQALGINSIINYVSIFGNSHWEILINDKASDSFFTSDFPVGYEPGSDPRVINKIIPLAPDLAVRICPDIRLSGAKADLQFSGFSKKRRIIRHQETIEINRRLVRCAEETIFFRDDRDWIKPFVSKNRYYRVEGITQSLPVGTGFFNVSTQRIVSTKR
jgi:hypothetical protein